MLHSAYLCTNLANRIEGNHLALVFIGKSVWNWPTFTEEVSAKQIMERFFLLRAKRRSGRIVDVVSLLFLHCSSGSFASLIGNGQR